MLIPGPAKKVTIHLNDDTSAAEGFLYDELFEFLLARGVSGASLIRPAAGFGSHHRIHEATGGYGTSDHMPVRIEFVESAELVADLLPELCEKLTDGMIEAHDTIVYKRASWTEAAI